MIQTRFAPSPTGRLHLGHAYSALFAARSGQRFLLRIEDIDPTRCRAEFEAGIFVDLAWIGLDWPVPVRRQSDHMAEYKAALVRLQHLGVLYPCFCTRAEILAEIAGAGAAPHLTGGEAVYPGTCRRLDPVLAADRVARGDSHALRLNLGAALKITGPLIWHDRAAGVQQARPEILGDVVLARKETPASYHLCVTHDDALQRVNLVTRGLDLFDATHIHRVLQALLHLPTPEYHHHGLLAGPDGKRFAKRDKSVTIEALRLAGHSAADVRAMAGFPDAV